jgi:excisionase family DNA binding protein
MSEKAVKLALSVLNAAGAIDVSRRQVENYVATGALPSFKLGRRRLIRLRDLEKFIAGDRLSPRVRETGNL